MRTTHGLFAVLAVCFVVWIGCKKSEQPVAQRGESYGVDWGKVDSEFANATPEVRDSVSLTKRFFRYAQFPRAMMELQKLAGVSSLTESQKKLVNDLIEQAKQEIAKAPAAGP